jgi:hypothetical protein
MRSREKTLNSLVTYTGVSPIKNYQNVDIGPPVANAPPQQQVHQPPNVQPPIALPYILPAPPVAAAQLPIPLIIITLPLRPFAPDGRKCQ